MALKETLEDLRYEFSLTTKVLSAFTDAGLLQQITPGGKSAGELAWHIVQAIPMIMSHVGITIEHSGVGSAAPTSAAEIVEQHRTVASGLLTGVADHWSDATLSEEVSVYGMTWTKGKTLQVILRHEIHHRAQLMLLLRQAGLKVPSVYGPSGDEK